MKVWLKTRPSIMSVFKMSQETEPTEELIRLRKIALLIGNIFVHGNFIAETANERELEELLRENGTFYDNLEEFDVATDKCDAVINNIVVRDKIESAKNYQWS